MHPDTMKHKASLWDGEFGTSRHITDVHWEGDITQQELAEVAEQISPDWQTVNLELDPAHPRHGQIYRLSKRPTWPRRRGVRAERIGGRRRAGGPLRLGPLLPPCR